MPWNAKFLLVLCSVFWANLEGKLNVRGALKMICHVVLYKMKTPQNEADEQKLAEAARRTIPTLPGVKNLKVGKNLTGPEKGYSLALVMDFENARALETYRVDADHQKFVKEIAGPLVEDILRFDFEWT